MPAPLLPMSVALVGLKKTFRTGTRDNPVLAGISLRLDSGEIAALQGENGAGKTTLLKILATLVSPDEGEITISGIDARACPALARGRIGAVLDAEHAWYQILTLNENLRFFGRMAGVPERSLAPGITNLARELAIERWLHVPVSQCSTGIRRRGALARALLPDPPVLLIDELMRGLDPAAEHAVTRLLKERTRTHGACCIAVTHDDDWARAHADRRWRLSAGGIVA